MNLRIFRRSSEKLGLPPGTPVLVAKDVSPTTITLLDYDEDHVEYKQISRAQEALAFRDTPSTTWIDIQGLEDVSTIEQLGKHYQVHPLVLEDILHLAQRPKVEFYENLIYIVCKLIRYDPAQKLLDTDQLSVVLGPNYVLTVQEAPSNLFDALRQRIIEGSGRARTAGPDYLAYAVIDIVADHYFLVLEQLQDEIDQIEELLFTDHEADLSSRLYELRQAITQMRRAVQPLLEAISVLAREEHKLIKQETKPFLRDLQDHIQRCLEILETHRESSTQLLELHMVRLNNRMSEVMKVLTIVATIFIPITFLAGVYGMNFEHMPELKIRWAYPAIWGIFITTALAMVMFFKRKRWL